MLSEMQTSANRRSSCSGAMLLYRGCVVRFVNTIGTSTCGLVVEVVVVVDTHRFLAYSVVG